MWRFHEQDRYEISDTTDLKVNKSMKPLLPSVILTTITTQNLPHSSQKLQPKKLVQLPKKAQGHHPNIVLNNHVKLIELLHFSSRRAGRRIGSSSHIRVLYIAACRE